MRKRLLLFFLHLFCSWAVEAQKLAHYDILLFSLNQRPDSLWHPFAPRFLTAFNPEGYNNQPQFFSSYEIYLTVQYPSDTTQTDIYALNVLLGTLTRVTATSTAEYSPTRMPDGKHFSVVRVEPDGRQRLWALPLNQADNGYPLLPQLDNVGYYCWLRDTLLALFLVDDNPQRHSLALIGLRQVMPRRVAVGIGRCLQKTPDGRLAFVQKIGEGNHLLKLYDPGRQVAETLVSLPSMTEDFALLPDGTYLVGHGAKLLQFHAQRQTTWTEIADLSFYGVQNISRIALSPEGRLMAIVVQ
ncbi:MAG: hypothetical protein NZM43_11065 [Saprospiraceae bacterium]|nr:hypothetical protein [Saprospiraceae bacterium]MDW8484847.1 hypothetical protein [Saprospiraceae bacterium]